MPPPQRPLRPPAILFAGPIPRSTGSGARRRRIERGEGRLVRAPTAGRWPIENVGPATSPAAASRSRSRRCRRGRRSGGSSCTIACSVSIVCSRANARVPVSISKRIEPSANRSARASTGPPRICSGARYPAVPRRTPLSVARSRRCRRIPVRQLGDAEVENLRHAGPRQEDVLGLQIAVDQARRVRRRQSVRDREPQSGVASCGWSGPRSIRVPQRLAFEQLGDEDTAVPSRHADVVDLDDVRDGRATR